MLKIELAPINADRKINPYRKREADAKGNFNLVYVYNVKGTPEELTEYKKVNPKAITDSKTNEVLFFTTRFVGKSADLNKTETGYFVDTRELDMFASLEKQWGATIAAQKMAELKA